MSFRGQSAIITGGASGIGRALGAALAAEGANVVLADVDGDAAARVASEIGGDAVGAHLDVRDREAVQALVDEVAARHGSLDLLFNNAGIALGGATHEMTGAHWDRIMDINVRGVVNGVLAAYPLMIRQGRGHIVGPEHRSGDRTPTIVRRARASTRRRASDGSRPSTRSRRAHPRTSGARRRPALHRRTGQESRRQGDTLDGAGR